MMCLFNRSRDSAARGSRPTDGGRNANHELRRRNTTVPRSLSVRASCSLAQERPGPGSAWISLVWLRSRRRDRGSLIRTDTINRSRPIVALCKDTQLYFTSLKIHRAGLYRRWSLTRRAKSSPASQKKKHNRQLSCTLAGTWRTRKERSPIVCSVRYTSFSPHTPTTRTSAELETADVQIKASLRGCQFD